MSNRIYFAKFVSENDFSDYWALVSNEQAMAMNGTVLTREEAKQLFDYILQINQIHEAFGYFKVFQEGTNNLIGLGAVVLNDDLTESEIEYMLLPEYWGNGYGTEMVDVLLNSLGQINTIQQVTAITDPTNRASQKILLKHGFHSLKVYEVDDGSFAEMFIRKMENAAFKILINKK